MLGDVVKAFLNDSIQGSCDRPRNLSWYAAGVKSKLKTCALLERGEVITHGDLHEPVWNLNHGKDSRDKQCKT
jgi:hypothetical protein